MNWELKIVNHLHTFVQLTQVQIVKPNILCYNSWDTRNNSWILGSYTHLEQTVKEGCSNFSNMNIVVLINMFICRN